MDGKLIYDAPLKLESDSAIDPDRMGFPTDRPRFRIRGSKFGRITTSLTSSLSSRLAEIAECADVGVFDVLLVAWITVLARWSGEQQVVLCVRFPRRVWPQEHLPGSEATLAILEMSIGGNQSMLDSLGSLRQECAAATTLRNQTSLGRAAVVALHAHDGRQTRLGFDIEDGSRHQRGLTTSPDVVMEECLIEVIPLGTELCMTLCRDSTVGHLDFAAELFDARTIAGLAESWEHLLYGIAADERGSLRQFNITSERTLAMILKDLNGTTVKPDEGGLVHRVFEAQVSEAPMSIAAVCGDGFMTYADLNARANQLAHLLKFSGVGGNGLVGICLTRSLEMLVGLIGVMKIGGAYIPLDPAYPADRLRYMLADSQPAAILTDAANEFLVRRIGGESKVLVIDLDVLAAWPTSNIDCTPSAPFQPAYVIYTSGSTGNPKGVLVGHAGVVNLLTFMRREIAVRSTDTLLAITTVCFDIAALELFLPLVSGARVVIAPQEISVQPQRLADLLEEFDCTILQATPATWRLLVDAGWRGRSNLKALCGGEALTSEVADQVLTRVEKLWNVYGPTETTIWSTACSVGTSLSPLPVERIGQPISNTEIYILDDDRRILPVGAVGEICIGGIGVALGYLNRPVLTAERFIAFSCESDHSARLYRSGDLGRWRHDGSLEYLGRKDTQVKIRGFRVELGEIEATLRELPPVREALVLLRGGAAQAQLVAYIVLNPTVGNVAPVVSDLQSHLRITLPMYMVPAAFVLMENFPLTPNGKIDRQALPAPTDDAYVKNEYVAARGRKELALAQIWRELFGLVAIGRDDNFFRLGGHSLMISRLIGRLRSAGFRVDAQTVYTHPTLSELALAMEASEAQAVNSRPEDRSNKSVPEALELFQLTSAEIAHIGELTIGGAANIQHIYPLSPGQEGILFHHLYSNVTSGCYLISNLFLVDTAKRVDELKTAIEYVINRHEVLRTAVFWSNLRRPVQVVHRKVTLPMEVLGPVRRDASIKDVKGRIAADNTRIGLSQAPLLRLFVAPEESSNRFLALLQVHHILMDNDSMAEMLSELKACIQGRVRELPTSIPYRKYVDHIVLESRAANGDSFFREKLFGIGAPTSAFLAFVRNGGYSDTNLHEAKGSIGGALARKLRECACRIGVSPATVFHVAWALALARGSGSDDVVFGTLLSARMDGGRAERGVLGMFISTLPLRVRTFSEPVSNLLIRTQLDLAALLNHTHVPLASAQACSGLPGSVPLFNTLFNYIGQVESVAFDDEPIGHGIAFAGSHDTTDYPIAVTVKEERDAFFITVQMYQPIGAERVLGFLTEAIVSLGSAMDELPKGQAACLDVLPRGERDLVLQLSRAECLGSPQLKLIHEVFEERVSLSPDEIALVCEGKSVTFDELNRQANRLARVLSQMKVGLEDLVGICLGREVEAIISMIATLKAGAAYIPIDPTYPTERIEQILRDASPRIVLASRRMRARLTNSTFELVMLDDIWSRVDQESPLNLASARQSSSCRRLAYLMYTSGSTGRPKGVMVQHADVLNLWMGLGVSYQAVGCRNVAVNASFGFDASVQQVIQLLSGLTVHLVSSRIRTNAEEMLKFIKDNDVHGIDCTPSQLKAWIYSGLFTVCDMPLKAVLVGGEAIDDEMWLQLAGQERITFYNVYGPTECTVDATLAVINGDRSAANIGRPMSNRSVYILDQNLRLAPLGVSGELYVGGIGVARGYLNRPELTAERFIADPFSTQGGTRLYRTGDLGRWRGDGSIEYLGRNDDQVKIRGFRIELGEIEAHLARHELLKNVVVSLREDIPGEKRLVAYFTARGVDVPRIEDLRDHLKRLLPDYMVPSAFVMLERFPLTVNGKLDKRALPVPATDAYTSHPYEAPQGETEEVVARIWREQLGIDRVGRDEDFFALGGNSITAMKVIVRLRAHWMMDVPMSVIFEYQNIRSLAVRINEYRRSSLEKLSAKDDSRLVSLLDRVSSMSDSAVDELVQKIRAKGKS